MVKVSEKKSMLEKLRANVLKERDPNLSHFQRVVFQKCGSLFPQKDDFLIVFYTDINIQFS